MTGRTLQEDDRCAPVAGCVCPTFWLSLPRWIEAVLILHGALNGSISDKTGPLFMT